MNPKIKKIDSEYEKNAAKITELQERQRELEKQRLELENLDIIGIVRNMGLTPDQMKRNINKLSGGEQQRVAIARALATNADILLADEPTGNLDADTAKGIVQVFRELAHEDGKCVIAVTHSQEFAAQADVVLTLRDKKLLAS